MNWWWLKRRIHPSWIIAWGAAAVVVGVWLAAILPQGLFASIGWLLTGIALVLTSLQTRFIALVAMCIIGGLLIGIWRGSLEQQQLTGYEQLIGGEIVLRGIIKEDIEQGHGGAWVLRLTDITYGDTSLPGTMWVTTSDPKTAQRSDIVTIHGTLNEGFGAIAASMYRARIEAVERPQPGDVALGVRDWFAGHVRDVIPEPEASLGLGYLLGQRRDLPPELDDALRIAGLTHVIVASGYNLTILVRLSRRLFMKLSRFSALAAATGMVASFIAITGNSPSMARAGLVTMLSLIAWYYGRRFHPLVLLPIAAAVTVIVNPSYAWGDVGWQLSFAAFAGVMLLAPLLQAYFFGDKKAGIVRQIMGETISAQIATLPILIATFGEFSTVAVLANLLVLPLVPLAMLLVFVTGVGSLIGIWLGVIVAAPTTWLLTYMIGVASVLSGQSWAMQPFAVDGWFIVGAYTALIGLGMLLWRITRYNFRSSSIVD